MKKKNITIIASILILGLIIYMAIPKKKEVASAPPPSQRSTQRVLPVNAYIVKPQSITDVHSANSKLIPSEEVDLSFETSGKITNIYFKEGSAVKKGDLLAKINDARLQAQLKKLQAQLELYKSKEFRQKTLLAQEAISQESYDESFTSVQTTLADIELINAQIKETELTAPFDGVLGLRLVSEGAYANPSMVIVKLTKISPLKLEFSVPEIYIDVIKPGTDVTFFLDQDTTEYKATVSATESRIDGEVHQIGIRAHYPNKNVEIFPGRFANIKLTLSTEQAGMSVPSESVIPEMNQQLVYVVRNNKARRAPITPGYRSYSAVQVLGGLNFGDTVVTTGILQLREGLDLNVTNIINE